MSRTSGSVGVVGGNPHGDPVREALKAVTAKP